MANRFTRFISAPVRLLLQGRFDADVAARQTLDQHLRDTLPNATLRTTGADQLLWNNRIVEHRGPQPYRTHRDGSIGLSESEVIRPLVKMLRTQNRRQNPRDIQRYATALRTLQQAYGQRAGTADRTVEQYIGDRTSLGPPRGDVALGHPIDRPHNQEHFAEFVGAMGLNDQLHSAVLAAPEPEPLAATNPHYIDAFTRRLADRTGTSPGDIRDGLRRLDQATRPAAVTDLVVRATQGAGEVQRDSAVWQNVRDTLAKHLTERPATTFRISQPDAAAAAHTAVDAAFEAAQPAREQPAEATAEVTQDVAAHAGRAGVADFGSTTAPHAPPDPAAARITAEGTARDVQR